MPSLERANAPIFWAKCCKAMNESLLGIVLNEAMRTNWNSGMRITNVTIDAINFIE